MDSILMGMLMMIRQYRVAVQVKVFVSLESYRWKDE